MALQGMRRVVAIGIAALWGLAGCGGGSDLMLPVVPITPAPTPAPATYPVGGTVTGLTGSVVLRNNGKDDLALSADGAFAFADPVVAGNPYAVTIVQQPEGQTCAVSAGQGTVDAQVSSVRVVCASQTYLIGGTVSGLAGTLVLRNNGSDELSVVANGRFRFAQALPRGAAYDVTVRTQPAGQLCTLAGASGTATGAVTSVAARCVADPIAVIPPIMASPTVAYAAKAFLFGWAPVGGVTYYRLGEDPTNSGTFSVLANNLTGAGYALQDLALAQPPASYRYALQACNTAGCSPWSLPVQPDPVQAIGYFKASNTRAGIRFGHTAVISRDGQTMAVGSDGDSSAATGVNGNGADTGAPNAGSVHVFARSGGSWTQQAYIKASNTNASDYFGLAIALSDDGSTLAVGAASEGSNAVGVNGNQADNSAASAGAAYVFTRSGNTWSQQAYIKASNTGAADQFGRSVALSADGGTLAVGARGEASGASGVDPAGGQADNSATSAGAAYVFTRSGPTWSQQAYIKASNASASANFGESVSLSQDGQTLAVGAFAENSGAAMSGAAYVFVRTGPTWSEQAFFKASNADAGDRFGASVALSGDGQTLAVGADIESGNGSGPTDNSAHGAGAAYVFTRAGNAWSEQAYLKAPTTDVNDSFGARLSISTDGSTLLVSAFGEDSNASGLGGDPANNSVESNGAAYLFTRSGATWTHSRYIKPVVGSVLQQFGASVSISGDGRSIAVGSQGDNSSSTGVGGDKNNTGAPSSGAVYLY